MERPVTRVFVIVMDAGTYGMLGSEIVPTTFGCCWHSLYHSTSASATSVIIMQVSAEMGLPYREGLVKNRYLLLLLAYSVLLNSYICHNSQQSLQ
jgi:hypothetical protein